MRICETAKLACTVCQFMGRGLVYYDRPITCPQCDGPAMIQQDIRFGESAGITTDNIPGGVVIRHLSNTPQTFYSKTDIKRAANEAGLKWADDTPGKPYNVKWSGKITPKEKVDPLL